MVDTHTRLGPYVLLERLRRWAHGFVELAYDTSANRFVALKSLAARARTPEAAQRFSEEVQLWRRLKHGHLLRLLDEGEREGDIWAAGEWLSGVDVDRLLETARNTAALPPPAIAATLAAQVGDALAFLHALAITAQSEIAPRNLVVSFEGRAALVELGNLRFLGRITPLEIDPLLSPYIAPEVRRGEPPTPRSDTYSLGVLLWFLLTGAVHSGDPETGETKDRLRGQVRQWRLDIEDDLLTVLWLALQENPRHRFETTRELKSALRAALEGGFSPTEEIGEYVKHLCETERLRRETELATWRLTYGKKESPEENVRTAMLDHAPIPRPLPRTGGHKQIAPPRPRKSLYLIFILAALAAALWYHLH